MALVKQCIVDSSKVLLNSEKKIYLLKLSNIR
jgi:hypothetical protein